MASLIALYATVALAAMFQTVTGIGFAMIAGPVILLTLGDNSAVQISILLNLLIAGILSPHLFKDVDRRLLLNLSIGMVAGLPLGVALFLWANVGSLKFITGLAVGGMALLLVLNSVTSFARIRPNKFTDFLAGAVTGVLTAFLAMPGPAVATYMAASNIYSIQTIRATVLVLFVIAYAGSLMVHEVAVGVGWPAYQKALELTPATLFGVGLGLVLGPRINERMFRICIIVALIITAASLLIEL